MRVVVAGNLGFIGREVERALSVAGHQVAGADRAPGDLEDRVRALDAEAVIWAAGKRSDDPAAMTSQHVTAAVEAMQIVKLRRFVYLSSGEVYGRQAVPFDEASPTGGSHPYAVAKLEGERACGRFATRCGTALTVLRLSVVYGPGQHGPMFIPSLIDHLLQGRRFPMTRGEQTRDFIFVDDVVAAVVRALTLDGPAGRYNIGSGEGTRLIDLARRIARAVGAGAEALLAPGAIDYRPNEQMRYQFAIGRAQRDLRFLPRVSLAEGIERVVAAARQRF